MSETGPDERRILIEAGSTVVLHPDGPAGGYPLVATVDHVADGLHWFLGSCDPIERGARLVVECSISNDARYTTRAIMEAASRETFALRLEPTWRRVQQRAFVRISAHGLQVRVVREKPDPPPPATDSDRPRRRRSRRRGRDGDTDAAPHGRVYELLDVSAGGIRFRADEAFRTDETVVCHFELPGSLCFVLAGRVVRGSTDPSACRPPGIAVEFVGMDDPVRSELLRWVYREQVRRHRAQLRAARKGAGGD